MLFTLQRLGIPTVFYVSDHWIVRGLPADVWLRWWNHADLSPRRLARALYLATGARQRWQALAPTNPVSQLRFPRIYFCSRALRALTAAAGYDVRHATVIYPPFHERYAQGPPQPWASSVRRLLYVAGFPKTRASRPHCGPWRCFAGNFKARSAFTARATQTTWPLETLCRRAAA